MQFQMLGNKEKHTPISIVELDLIRGTSIEPILLQRPTFDLLWVGELLVRRLVNVHYTARNEIPRWKLVLVTDKNDETRRVTIYDQVSEDEYTEDELLLANLFTIKNQNAIVSDLERRLNK